ncbi:Ig-like domain-containing protein [Streptomyces sp. NPDC047725]|uniref:Ig-like domain-containing protein n=1 Tax=Streptomyces sp. NPDC047725 TaxID=3365487 RepID=UPI003711784C
MTCWKGSAAWKLTWFAALPAVVVFASPAAAADSSTTALASPSAVVIGQSVNLSAVVTCPFDPSGGLGVTFFDGANELFTAEVDANGQTMPQAVELTTVGTHTITAAYSGNGNDKCSASYDETTVVVSAAPVPPPNENCLIACGGLVNYVSDSYNEVDSHNYNMVNYHSHNKVDNHSHNKVDK